MNKELNKRGTKLQPSQEKCDKNGAFLKKKFFCKKILEKKGPLKKKNILKRNFQNKGGGHYFE